MNPHWMKLTSTQVRRVKPDAEPAKALAGTAVKALTKGDYLFGFFDHSDGRRAVLLNNYRFAYTAWPTVEFDVDASQVVEVDPATGDEVSVRDDSPAMEGLQISLDSGAGRLFLLPGRSTGGRG